MSTSINDRYTLFVPLGEQELGTTWRGEDKRTGQSVAIVVLDAPGAGAEKAKEHFFKQAHAVAGIEHPNVVRVHEVDTTADGNPFLVMELLEGQSLLRRFAQTPPMTLQEAVGLIAELLSGIDAVHAAGLVHGDIEPGNVFLATQGGVIKPKLIGFGLNRALARAGVLWGSDTDTGLLASMAYMPPEQANGTFGERGDLYGVGAILYAAAVGKPPHRGNTETELRQSVARGASPIQRERREVPFAVAAATMRALALDPAKRFADASAMRKQLMSPAVMSPKLAQLFVTTFVPASAEASATAPGLSPPVTKSLPPPPALPPRPIAGGKSPSSSWKVKSPNEVVPQSTPEPEKRSVSEAPIVAIREAPSAIAAPKEEVDEPRADLEAAAAAMESVSVSSIPAGRSLRQTQRMPLSTPPLGAAVPSLGVPKLEVPLLDVPQLDAPPVGTRPNDDEESISFSDAEVLSGPELARILSQPPVVAPAAESNVIVSNELTTNAVVSNEIASNGFASTEGSSDEFASNEIDADDMAAAPNAVDSYDSFEDELIAPSESGIRSPALLLWGAAAIVSLVIAGGLLWDQHQRSLSEHRRSTENVPRTLIPDPEPETDTTELPSAAASALHIQPTPPQAIPTGHEADAAIEPPSLEPVALVGVPAGASVLIDGRSTKRGALTVPRDGRTHAVEINAEGFEPWQRTIGPDAPAEVSVDLVAAPPPVVEKRSAHERRSSRRRRSSRASISASSDDTRPAAKAQRTKRRAPLLRDPDF